MRLGATITSERGKPVTKTGNEYIQIQINDEKGIIYGSIHIYPTVDKYVFVQIHGQKEDFRLNGNLKHGKEYKEHDPYCAVRTTGKCNCIR